MNSCTKMKCHWPQLLVLMLKQCHHKTGSLSGQGTCCLDYSVLPDSATTPTLLIGY